MKLYQDLHTYTQVKHMETAFLNLWVDVYRVGF